MKLFVYHTPELTPIDRVPDCAIAVDVLRATTTMATAIAAGAEAIQVFSDVEKLFQVSEQWPADQRLRAGERGGQKVAGCDLGNSPLDCTPDVVKGCRLFMTTTNGTRALQRIQTAPIVLAAALVNRQAVVDYLLAKPLETIWIVGSGWEGGYSLEDTVCAGAIVARLQAETGIDLEALAGNDEVVAALALYQHWQERLLPLMHAASHGQRLLRLDRQADLKYCAQMDTLPIVPIQTEPGTLVRYQN